MQITVDERLGFREEFVTEACRGYFELPVTAKGRDDVIELRRGVTVARADEVRIRENQVYADAHQRLVRGEQGDSVHLAFERPREVGGEETGTCDELADGACDIS